MRLGDDMRDYKNYRAPECVHVTRMTTYLIVAALMALLAWTQDRDSHPFNDVKYVQVEE